MQTVFGGRLDEEPRTEDISRSFAARKDHISKLLLGSQLVKSGLFKELESNLVQYFVFEVRTFWTLLIVANDTRVIIARIINSEVNSLEMILV